MVKCHKIPVILACSAICNAPVLWIHLTFWALGVLQVYRITRKPSFACQREEAEREARLFKKHAFLYKKVQGYSWRHHTSLNLIFKAAHIFWPMVRLQSDRHFPACSAVTPGWRGQPPRGPPWVSGVVGHFVQTWPDSECSHTVQYLDCSDLNWRCNRYHLFWHDVTLLVLMCR